MIKLDERLKAVADIVPTCRTVADIGSDHGLLPCFLILEEKAEKAVITDISELSLNKARELAGKLNLQKRASFHIADGFKGIDERIDCAVIAGMGGVEIMDILAGIPPETGFLVLQPMRNVPELRKYLAENGFFIEIDKKVFCRSKFYDVIRARNGEDSLTREELLFGRTNLKEKGETFFAYLTAEREKAQRILKGIGKGCGRKRELEERLELIGDILKVY